MATEMRYRNPSNDKHTANASFRNSPDSVLTVDRLLQASPQESGFVQKLHIPLIFSLLPSFLQRFFLNFPTIFSCLLPRWKRRYFVLLGGYLYKFMDDTPGTYPKGTPIPVCSMDAHLLNESNRDENFLSASFSVGKPVIAVGTVFKKHYFATSSRDEAVAWINSLQQAQKDYIARQMGHVSRDAVPKSWAYYDRLGESLVQRNTRIRSRLEESRLVELAPLGTGIGLPQGYYG